MNEAISLEGFNPLLSEAVKNDKAVKNLSQTVVLFANLLVELSTHMDEEAFAPVKEKVLDFIALADEVFKAITPVEVVEEAVPEVVSQGVTLDQKWSPVLGAAKEVDPSVQAIFDSLEPSVRSTASSTIGVKTNPKVVQEIVREQTRKVFRSTVEKGIVSSIRNGASIDTLTAELEAAAGVPLTAYEKAIGYAEHWRHA